MPSKTPRPSADASAFSILHRIHEMQGERVLAAADSDVLGKKWSGGVRVLDLAAFRSFYEGEALDERALESALGACTMANLAGPRAVGVALRMGLADPESVVDIGGLPHVQIYRLK